MTLNVSDLERLWASQEGRCFFTHIPLAKTCGRLDSVSLDRLDAAGGYTPGNVVLTASAINLARNSASVGEFQEFLRLIRAATTELDNVRRLKAAG